MRTVHLCLTHSERALHPEAMYSEPAGDVSVRIAASSAIDFHNDGIRLHDPGSAGFVAGLPEFRIVVLSEPGGRPGRRRLGHASRALSELRHAGRVFLSFDADPFEHACILDQINRINPHAEITAERHWRNRPGFGSAGDGGPLVFDRAAFLASCQRPSSRAYAGFVLRAAGGDVMPPLKGFSAPFALGAVEAQMLLWLGGAGSSDITAGILRRDEDPALDAFRRHLGGFFNEEWRGLLFTAETSGWLEPVPSERQQSTSAFRLSRRGRAVLATVCPGLEDFGLPERVLTWMELPYGEARAEIDAYSMRFHDTQRRHLERMGIDLRSWKPRP